MVQRQTQNRSITLTLLPPPGRRVPRCNGSTGEGGRAPWRLVQDWDKEGLQGRSVSSGSNGGAGSSGGHGHNGNRYMPPPPQIKYMKTSTVHETKPTSQGRYRMFLFENNSSSSNNNNNINNNTIFNNYKLLGLHKIFTEILKAMI